MIRQVVREAWAQSPAEVIAAVLLTPVAVLVCWFLLVVVLLVGASA